MKITRFNLPLALALVAALAATDAQAQNGKGKGNSNRDRDRDRVEQRDRRDRDDDDDDRRREPRFERRRTDDQVYRGSTSGRRVPPGWCNGRGNPHNTPENCRWNSSRDRWERYDSRDRRWEDQSTWERGTNGSYGDRGSYETAHRQFHASHDRQCRERAAQRPLDLRYQVQVRQECRAIHEEFHRRWGTNH